MRFFQPLHKGILNVSEHMRFIRIAVIFFDHINKQKRYALCKIFIK